MNISTLAERIQRTRDYESRQKALAAIESARLAHRLPDDIISLVRPGMRESEVKQAALEIFMQNGIERTWHPPYVRFAGHTLLIFQDKAQEDCSLSEDAIAFIDIGIVKDDVEGDAGRTVVFRERPEFHLLREASETIFTEAKEFWRQFNPSGIELYHHIHTLADKMDVQFNLNPAGHLIGEFPHRGWKKGFNNFPEKVAPGCWILEIQLCDKERKFGAFMKIFFIK